MHIGRTVPPAAAPLGWTDLCHALGGVLRPARAIRRIEDDMRRHFGVRHVFLVSSGTAALTLVLESLRSLSDRREAVIPAYTCFSVPAAVLEARLRPTLCDIGAGGFDYDRTELEQVVSDATLCVVAHHLFGIPSDVEAVRAICRARGIVVVEDAAQAMGIEAGGRCLGTIGDVGVFSLGRGKSLTCGSGGIVVTNDDRIADAIERRYRRLPAPSLLDTLRDVVMLALMAIFIRPSLYSIPAALPCLGLGQTIFPKRIVVKSLSGMQAGALRRWRVRLARSNDQRARTSAYFSERLALAPACGPSHPYLRLPVVCRTAEERDAIFSLSHRLGVGVAYPTPVSEIPEIRRMFLGRSFPAARDMASRLLTLPTHHWLTHRDKGAIVRSVEGFTRAVRAPAEWQKAEGIA